MMFTTSGAYLRSCFFLLLHTPDKDDDRIIAQNSDDKNSVTTCEGKEKKAEIRPAIPMHFGFARRRIFLRPVEAKNRVVCGLKRLKFFFLSLAYHRG